MSGQKYQRGRQRWVVPVVAVGIVLNLGLTGVILAAVAALVPERVGHSSGASDGETGDVQTDNDAPGAIGLDLLGNFDTPTAPIWSFPSLEGYDFDIIDEQGINRQTNRSSGCIATTSQTEQEPLGADPTSDRAETEASLDTLVATLGEGKAGVTTADPSTVENVAVGTIGGQQKIEFLATRFTFTGEDTTYTYQVAVRALPQEKSLMWLSVLCPTSVVIDEPGTFTRIVNRTAVVFA
ncbi:hypothetical protein GCM10022198_07840 [Klugiella xanthotipulae]|uniref:Uncharacterized protein n=1 Tax=Klugiella xanthotipulae TaxID=244735 RepID=A0A543HSY8_9MICO|nr:hypothetical protein [Klugiella xanthotipulae]TQM61456.1 hypothetical protein FB466_2410 [Klugiella xanthotipulae]